MLAPSAACGSRTVDTLAHTYTAFACAQQERREATSGAHHFH